MLSGLKGSLQSELNAFFPQLQNGCDFLRAISAQAVSTSRKRFSFVVFSLLNQRLLKRVESTFAVPRWHGLRVVAGDASKLRLFLRDATKRQVQEAIAFALYLPGIEMSLAFHPYSPSVGERQMLFEHLEYLRPDDLLVLDRGYPGNWLIAVLTQRGQHFCMRADDTGYECVKAFKRIKHRLNLEHLSGISWLAAQQDFGAKMLCDNLNALAVFCATEQNLDAQVRSGYGINRTYTFAHLKRCLPRWLVKQWPTLDELVSVFAELAKNLVRFVKGLSKPRPAQPKPHKAMAYKSRAIASSHRLNSQ